MPTRIRALVVTVAIFCSVGQPALATVFSKLAPIYNPEPILVPDGKQLRQISAAIKRSLLANNWQAQNIGNGHLEAAYKRGSWQATVAIQYNIREIKITYKDSNGLGYSKATGEIHKTYNGLVQELEQVIRGQIRD